MSFYELYVISGNAMIASSDGDGPSYFAQISTVIVCFLILYWILNKYAFGPVLAVIDERREKIEADLQKAEDLSQQAETERAELEKRLTNIEEESRAKMQELIAEGRRVSDSIKQKAQTEAAGILEKAQKNIEHEIHKARVILKKEVIDMTVQATEKIIKVRLDDAKHRELIGDFLSKIDKN